jgi:hypothetical protein
MAQMNDNLEERNRALSQLPLDPKWAVADFGPNFPIPSEALDEPDEHGFAIPRIHQYRPGINLQLQRNGHVPWETLKQAADQPLFRACIEIRKQRISTLDWCFRVKPSYAARVALKSGRNEYEVQEDLRKEFQEEIDRLTTWWEIPDRKNGLETADWLSQVQEEQLTWDALAIYPHKTYGGDLLNFTVIDGSTIKPLLDEQGGRPMPPLPAYQQLLYGFPRGDFTADTVDLDGKLVVPGAFSSSQLIYRRRVVRTWTPYGYSPTEQALLDGALWDKRFRWMMAEYTEGAQPVQYLVNKGDTDWDPRQLLSYEKFLNDRLAGKTAERFRNPLLPVGVEPVRTEQNNERYKPEYDLFLIKLQAMHFGVTMPELGFTEAGGLGSTGYHEGEEDIQFRKDLTTVRWLNDFVSSLSRTHLNMPDAIEFTFLGLDEEDEGVADAIDESRLKGARATINECRGRLGLPAKDFPEADMLMLMTERGVVFLEGASEAAPPGVLIEPAELSGSDTAGEQTDPAPAGPAKQKVQGSPQPARPVKQSPSAADMAKELEQFAKWLGKAPEGRKPFEFRHLDPANLAEAFKAADGDKDTCPCGTPVVYDWANGWQHGDGSISHDDGESVSDKMALAKAGGNPKVSSSNGPDGSGLTHSSPYSRPSS